MRCLSHEPCPKCGSRDNVGVWEDGHKWCFGGCGYYVPPTGSIKPATQPLKAEPRGIYLPEDVEPYYPFKCLQWVKQYDLSENDLRANQVVWSESNQLLIFPYMEDGARLTAWQGRNFGSVHGPKWYGRGNLEDVFSIKGESSRQLIVVEDVISSIVLGRAGYQAMPIFGSYISDKRLTRLKVMIDHLVIWLDKDKAKEAHKFCKRAQVMGFDSRTIVTEKDPKCYISDKIKEILK